jgi:hypothetical protein
MMSGALSPSISYICVLLLCYYYYFFDLSLNRCLQTKGTSGHIYTNSMLHETPKIVPTIPSYFYNLSYIFIYFRVLLCLFMSFHVLFATFMYFCVLFWLFNLFQHLFPTSDLYSDIPRSSLIVLHYAENPNCRSSKLIM